MLIISKGAAIRCCQLFLMIGIFGPLFADNLPDLKFAKFMDVEIVSEEPLVLNGLKVKSFSFQSSKGNRDIVKFYKKLWNGQIRSLETQEWIYHSNFDGKYLYTVQVRKKKTGVFSSSSDISGIIGISEPGAIKNVSRKVKKERFYPITVGTNTLTDLSNIDLGKKSRTTVFDSPGRVRQNLQHYKLHFEKKGWNEALDRMSDAMVRDFGGSTLIMQKGHNELVISFIPDKSGRTKIVSVLVNK